MSNGANKSRPHGFDVEWKWKLVQYKLLVNKNWQSRSLIDRILNEKCCDNDC